MQVLGSMFGFMDDKTINKQQRCNLPQALICILRI